MELSENKEIIERLAEIYRENRVKSVRAFALSFGADPSFYAKIHKGEADLTERIAEDIANKYGVNKEWLFTGDGPKKPTHPISIGSSENEKTLIRVIDKQADAFRDQAEAFKALAELAKNIEKNMARQDLQEKMDANLTLALTGIEALKFARDRADQRDAKNAPDINPPSGGSRKKGDGTDGDGHKRGIRP